MRSTSANGAGPLGVAVLVLLLLMLASATPASGHTPNSAEGVVINEVTPSGWLWQAADEFVELRNTTDQTVVLHDWKLVACVAPGTSKVIVRFGSAHVVPPQGFLLIANVAYNRGTGGEPDARYGADVPEDGGWLLQDPGTAYTDGVGLRDGLVCTEGGAAPRCDWAAGEAATRNQVGRDTDENAEDFTCQPRTPGF